MSGTIGTATAKRSLAELLGKRSSDSKKEKSEGVDVSKLGGETPAGQSLPSGKTRTALQALLDATDRSSSEESTGDLFAGLFTPKNGESLKSLLSLQLGGGGDTLADTLDAADSDGDGSVSAAEASAYAETADMASAKSRTFPSIDDLDTDGDGTISKKEFKQAFRDWRHDSHDKTDSPFKGYRTSDAATSVDTTAALEQAAKAASSYTALAGRLASAAAIGSTLGIAV